MEPLDGNIFILKLPESLQRKEYIYLGTFWQKRVHKLNLVWKDRTFRNESPLRNEHNVLSFYFVRHDLLLEGISNGI